MKIRGQPKRVVAAAQGDVKKECAMSTDYASPKKVSSAEVDAATVKIARAASIAAKYPQLQPGFATFVAEALAQCEQPGDPNSSKLDAGDLREAEDRQELLDELHTMFEAGHAEPVLQFELIGFVWMYIANRCDSSLLVAAEKLWLEFEESLPG